MSKLLTPGELAQRLQVSIDTLQRWRSQGKGPTCLRLSCGKKGAIRYKEEAVERWLKSLEEEDPRR